MKTVEKKYRSLLDIFNVVTESWDLRFKRNLLGILTDLHSLHSISHLTLYLVLFPVVDLRLYEGKVNRRWAHGGQKIILSAHVEICESESQGILEIVCHEAARKMRVGPSESACRSRLQTTLSCCGKEPWW